MKMIRLAVATVSVATLGLVVAPAAPASADPSCTTGEVCVYYRGSLIWKGGPITSGCKFIRGQFDYVRNLASIGQVAWSGTECNGRKVPVPAGHGRTVDQFWALSRR